eukprot:SAG22_NODE_2322_length_2717_cov_5.829641_3_plen_110_part_00
MLLTSGASMREICMVSGEQGTTQASGHWVRVMQALAGYCGPNKLQFTRSIDGIHCANHNNGAAPASTADRPPVPRIGISNNAQPAKTAIVTMLKTLAVTRSPMSCIARM